MPSRWPLKANRYAALLIALSVLSALGISRAYADMSSWMEDNRFDFRYHTLETLSLPASHDAALYAQDSDLAEIGVSGLYGEVTLSLLGLVDIGIDLTIFDIIDENPYTGIIMANDLIDLMDAFLDEVRKHDTQCFRAPGISICQNFDFSGRLEGWVNPYKELALAAMNDLSVTQNLDFYGQLSNGVRMFDLRVKRLDDTFYAHHSTRIDAGEVGGEEEWSDSLDIYVPCVNINPLPFPVICAPLTGESHELGSVHASAGGEVRSVSSTGPELLEVLSDVRRYMEEGHKELLVIELSHFWEGYRGNEFGADDYQSLIQMVQEQLGPWLLSAGDLKGAGTLPPETLVRRNTLSHILRRQGRVLFVVDTSDDRVDPHAGIWPHSVVADAGGWSNKDTRPALEDAQRSDFLSASGPRFELWWTLTCQPDSYDCSVRDLASEINPHLSSFVSSLGLPGSGERTLNEIWVDFSEETAAAAIAIDLNRWNAPPRPPYPLPSGQPIPTLGFYSLSLLVLLTGWFGARAQRKRSG